MLSNCSVGEKTLESPLDCKEIKPVNPKGNQPWIFIGRTDAETEVPILWSPDAKSLLFGRWCWERLKAEGDDRGRDGWMASPTQRTWVWTSSGRWWRTGKPGILQSMGSQRDKIMIKLENNSRSDGKNWHKDKLAVRKRSNSCKSAKLRTENHKIPHNYNFRKTQWLSTFWG